MRSISVAFAFCAVLLFGCGALLSARPVDVRAAAAEGDLESVRQLLKADPNTLNSTDAEGRTPLILAAAWGHPAVASFLIDKGAALNAVDKNGHTALHWAAVAGRKAIVELLLRAKADPAIPDRKGLTARQLAVNEKLLVVVQIFDDVAKSLANPPLTAQDRKDREFNTLNLLGKAEKVELVWTGAELTPASADAARPETLAADCAALNADLLGTTFKALAQQKAAIRGIRYVVVSVDDRLPRTMVRNKLGEPDGTEKDPAQTGLVWHRYGWLHLGIVDEQVQRVRADCARLGGQASPSALGREKKNPKDGAAILLIPAGPFSMGNDAGDGDERPIHSVTLSGYWVYKTCVTVAQFRKFCQETNRTMPNQPATATDAHPVVKITWADAQGYANWAGGRLPTEAEWEKAARGTDGRKFPWGNDFDMKKCNALESNNKHAMPVGSYPDGASPCGALDMVGNVYQWCLDWYQDVYYQQSPAQDPTGPAAVLPAEKVYGVKNARCIRGGSFNVTGAKLYAANRMPKDQDDRSDQRGFRVVLPENAIEK